MRNAWLSLNKTDLQALYIRGTYYYKTGARPPSCAKPRQPTISIFFQHTENSFQINKKRQKGIAYNSFKISLCIE